MNPSEHNHEDLQRLLKLKRHEVPPPGYFNHFSGDVIARIKAGEAMSSGSFVEYLQDHAPWVFTLVRLFETKPGVVGGLATSLCVLLVFGLVMTENTDNNSSSMPTFSASTQAPSVSSPTAMASSNPLLAGSPGIALSTNPVTSLQPVATIFGQPAGAPMFQAASFAPGN
jgi:hypothetical protein